MSGMKKYNYVTFFTLLSILIQGQDTLTISKNTGNVIDSAEKVRYGLFYNYSIYEFHSAIFLLNPDSSITLKTILKPAGVAERKISKQEYERIKTRIDEDQNEKSSIREVNLPPNRRPVNYSAKIITMSGKIYKGFLERTDSDHVTINSWQIPAGVIKSIRLRKKGTIAAGVLRGLFIGVAASLVVGLAIGNTPLFFGIYIPWYDYAISSGLIIVPSAMIVGGIFLQNFSIGIKIHLNGNKSNYRKIENNLNTYCTKIKT